MKYYITSQSDSEAFSIPKNGPWLKFFETIFAAGHEIVPLEECPDIIVFMNNHPNLLKRVARVNKTAIKILVLWEPKVTRACNFSENNSRDFDFIFSPSPRWISGDNVEYFPWPQGSGEDWKSEWVKWQERSNKMLVFQSNKFSFTKGELYSLRRMVIKGSSEQIDLYGSGWGDSRKTLLQMSKAAYSHIKWNGLREFTLPRDCFFKPLNYKGYATEKMRLLSQTKFSLVIENSSDYISEKLFDSAIAGNVAVYVGPPLKTFGVPRIALEASSNFDSVYEAINRAQTDSSMVADIRESLHSYIGSMHFHQMRNDIALTYLANRIILRVNCRVNYEL